MLEENYKKQILLTLCKRSYDDKHYTIICIRLSNRLQRKSTNSEAFYLSLRLTKSFPRTTCIVVYVVGSNLQLHYTVLTVGRELNNRKVSIVE